MVTKIRGSQINDSHYTVDCPIVGVRVIFLLHKYPLLYELVLNFYSHCTMLLVTRFHQGKRGGPVDNLWNF